MAINSPLLELSIAGARGVLFSIAGGDDVTMFEIQDAAKIITESVDPSAKIIFGTVHTDKLNKNEIKITVIASGFPESGTKKSLFQTTEETQKGKIFNSIPVTSNKEAKIENKNVTETKTDIEDDWGAVPAFLRRNKIK